MARPHGPVVGGILTVLLVGGCAENEPGTWAMRPASGDATFPARDEGGAVIAAGRTVSAEDLDRGRMAYVDFCASCHGLDGDGRGPEAAGMSPPPRDFRKAAFKFAAVRSGELPNDADLARVVRFGLQGTRMPAWGIDPADVVRVNDFLKTFPPADCVPGPASAPAPCERSGPWMRVGGDGHPKRKTGEPVRMSAGFVGKQARRGPPARGGALPPHRRVHELPPGLPDPRRSRLPSRRGPQGKWESPSGIGTSRPVPVAADKSPFGVELIPPDFRTTTLRTVRPGHELPDTWLVIASGASGVMPAWIDALPEQDIWAIAHYVDSLTPRWKE
jgi:mono/diheme cytochrome c family protein